MDVLATSRARFKPLPKGPWLDGIITMTGNHVSWVPNNPATAQALNVNFETIKAHHFSSATSKKALLKLGTSTDPKAAGGYVFEFDSVEDRDKCSNVAGRLLAKRRQAGGGAASGAAAAGTEVPRTAAAAPMESINMKEVEQRARILGSDRELANLHAQLVTTGTLTEGEFWQTRKHLLQGNATGQIHQRRGLASAMLADVRPSTDGKSNTISFSLTAEIIHQIFAEKPAVHKAYLANVPDKMSEKDFWTKYCRAEYFHRTRTAAQHAANEDEDGGLFEGDREMISEEAKRKLKKVDPTVNVVADEADDYIHSEGHGIERDGMKENPEILEKKSARTIVHQLNRHSSVVLEGRPSDQLTDAAAAAAAIAKARDAVLAEEKGGDDNLDKRVAERIQEMTFIPDLHEPPPPPLVPLRIQDPRRYFDGAETAATGAGAGAGAAAAVAAGSGDASGRTSSQPQAEVKGKVLLEKFKRSVEELQPGPVACPTVTADASYKVFTDLMQLISNATEQRDKRAEGELLKSIPRAELFQSCNSVYELLRHFWGAYPITNQHLAQKVDRLRDAMATLYDNLQKTREALLPEQRHQISQLLQPLFQALDAAFAKHELEQQQRARKMQRINGAASVSHKQQPRQQQQHPSRRGTADGPEAVVV